MDLHTRRILLETDNNPDRRLDYVVTLQGRVRHGSQVQLSALVRLRYIPDALILPPQSFIDYLDALSKADWPSLEQLSNTILDDFNNEIVPRWVQLNVSAPFEGEVEGEHSVTLEDRQPTWSNEHLIARLKPL